MKNLQQYEKLFSRDFSLPTVEVWMTGEVYSPTGTWTDKVQPFLPYEVAERANGTTHFYYNLQGVEWTCELLLKLSEEDKHFIPNLEKTIVEKLTFIQPIYEKQKAVSFLTLKEFLSAFADGLPWFYAMWLFTEWMIDVMPEKLEELNIKGLEELRRKTENLLGASDVVIRKSLRQLYPNLGMQFSVIRIEELLSENIPSKEILEERYKGYFFSNNQLFLLSKDEVAKKLGIHFIEETTTNKKVNQLQGSPACKGLVKGYVRILMGHDQIALLKEGEVLVTPMTIPDFLPAMKKASAFVTDEGGILCHAAIVAREFNKPCIVGTKLATQVLKDGDYIEVDANKGLVTLIKRHVGAMLGTVLR